MIAAVWLAAISVLIYAANPLARAYDRRKSGGVS